MNPLRTLSDSVNVPPISHVLSWASDYGGPLSVIDASQGTTGATPPQSAIPLDKHSEQYGPRWGAADLRAAIARDVATEYCSSDIQWDNVLVTAGCNEAFCAVVRALAAPGDRVILLSPFYFNHDMWLRLNGIEPVYVELLEDGHIDYGHLTEAARQAAAVCAVSPSNPTGVELADEAIDQIVSACRRSRIPFILDETYAAFRRDASRAPHDVFCRADWGSYFISLRSFSKEFSIPGYRIGAAIADPYILEAASKWHDCMSIVAPSPGQVFAEYALEHLTVWKRELADDIRTQGQRFVSRLESARTGFGVTSWGGLFAWVNHPFLGASDEQAARRIASEVGVLTVPGKYFARGDTGHVRLSYGALSQPLVEDIVMRLAAVSI